MKYKLYKAEGALGVCKYFIRGVYVTLNGLVTHANSYDLSKSQTKHLADARDKLYSVKITVENTHKEIKRKIKQ